MALNPVDQDKRNSHLVNSDGSYNSEFPLGNKPVFTVYSDADYPPIPSIEPPVASRRVLGGAGASDANDGILVADGGTGPWASLDKALQEYGASSTWYAIKIAGDITVSASIWSKFYGTGPGSLSQFGCLYGDPDLPSRPKLILEDRVRIDGQPYMQYWGFDIELGTDGISATNSGFELGEDTATHHQCFRDVNGTAVGLGGDNIGFVVGMNANADYLGVFDCNFDSVGYGAGVHGNTSCVIFFRTTNVRIENNILSNAPRPIYEKHANLAANGAAGIYIRYNWDKQGAAGGQNLGCFFAGRKEGGTYNIHGNIFGNDVEISNGGGADQPVGVDFWNNTCQRKVDVQDGNDPAITGTYYNNIVEGNFIIYNGSTPEDSDNLSNYQLYAGNIVYKGTSNSLAAWQAGSTPSGQDANSIAGSPTYTGGATPSTIAGFALTGASNGYQAGNDGADMGADTSKVGTM